MSRLLRGIAAVSLTDSVLVEKPNSSSAPSSFKGVNALTIPHCPGCNVNNGGGVNFINSNAGAFNLNGGGSVSQNDPSFAMSDFATPLDALQTKLATMITNSNFSSPNNKNLMLNVTPDASGTAVSI